MLLSVDIDKIVQEECKTNSRMDQVDKKPGGMVVYPWRNASVGEVQQTEHPRNTASATTIEAITAKEGRERTPRSRDRGAPGTNLMA